MMKNIPLKWKIYSILCISLLILFAFSFGNVLLRIFVFLIALILSYFFVSKIISPIQNLVKEIPEEIKDIIERKINIEEKKDEVSLLSEVFQHIIEESREKKQELSQILEEQKTKVKEMDRILEKKIYDLFTLFEVAKELNSTLDPEVITKTVVFTCMAHLGVTSTTIFLLDNFIDINASGNILVPAIMHGLDESVKQQIKFNISGDFARFIKQQRKPITKSELDQILLPEDEIKNLSYIKFSLCAPLIVKDELKGVLFLGPKKTPGAEFSQENIDLLSTLVGLAALALENARLYTLAITDGLTKVYTHRYFQLRLKEEIQRAIRYKHPLTLIMGDIDHFKEINDKYGHQVGDKILADVAKLCKTGLRACDFVARYGGEEFVLVLPEVNQEQGYIAAERIRKTIEKYFLIHNDTKISVTMSFGISSLPENSSNEIELIENADKALYRSKKEGRNKSCMYGK